MRAEITVGQTSDYLGFDLLMADNLPEPGVLLADRGYDSDNIRKTMKVRDVVPVIPMCKTRELRVSVDRRLYRLPNLVERCFYKLKNARRAAARYDKTAESFLGFIDITLIRLWLCHLATRLVDCYQVRWMFPVCPDGNFQERVGVIEETLGFAIHCVTSPPTRRRSRFAWNRGSADRLQDGNVRRCPAPGIVAISAKAACRGSRR